jgi:2-amino-4-hydroxy-6-hydroxymethyldihydropteridine diphosphokinase
MLVSSLSGDEKTNMSSAYIGIGSNVDRNENIHSGISQLKKLGTELIISSVYESKAYGFTGDNFYNLVIGLKTDITPFALVSELREIEQQHGRTRNEPRFSSRTLDLDLLLYDNMICHDDRLNLPRGDILTCAFVLGPLAEIAGHIRHPETGVMISDIWTTFKRPEQEIWAVNFNLDT